MRHTLSIACLCVMHSICAQWTEDFSNGLSPEWKGDTSHFIINAKEQLQLNASQAGISSIWRKYATARPFEWEFTLGLDFNPSSSNKLEVFLFADSSAAQSSFAAIIELGENGNLDTWKFYLKQNFTKSLVAKGEDGLLAIGPINIKLKFKMEQDSLWTVFIEWPIGTGLIKTTNFILSLPELKNEMYFGIQCLYSESRSKLFTFDDIYLGFPRIDNQGPQIIDHKILNPLKIEFSFDEACDTVLSQVAQKVYINAQPAIMNWINFATIQVIPSSPIVNMQKVQLDYSNIYDVHGNKTEDAFYVFDAELTLQPSHHEILISEILADPSPSLGLPEAEFIELFNNSAEPLNLRSCKLYDGSSFILFPDFIITPGEYIIVCSYSDSLIYSTYGKVLALPNVPSLNNDGDELTLRDSSNAVIFEMKYDLNDYGNPLQSNGGYSLELVNKKSLCLIKENWKASKSSFGGTPGKQNSWNEEEIDLKGPELISVNPLSEWEVKLIFNEALESDLPFHINRFSISPDKSIASIEFSGNRHNEIIILLHQPLDFGIHYQLLFNELEDCLGNKNSGQSLTFGRPEDPEWQDIVFSEVLFNSYSNHFDFIELYNRSKKFISLSGLLLANLMGDGLWYPVKSDHVMAPNSFMALTKDPDDLSATYPESEEKAIASTEIPPMEDQGAVLLLSHRNWTAEQLLDSAVCLKEWHNPFLGNDEGVSLEKLNFSSSSSLKNSWESTAASHGYATPGNANSHSWPGIKSENKKPYQIHPKVFSPDNDGVDDLVWINFTALEPGYKCSVDVYDVSGLFRNRIYIGIPSSGELLSWNGINSEGFKSPAGNYILLIQLLNPSGIKTMFKEQISLIN